MDDRLARLESQVTLITAELRTLERRLAALDSPPAPPEPRSAGTEPSPPSFAPAGHPRPAPDAVAALSAVGRLLLALGGAFLLRALTDAGTLRPAAGVSSGFLYALVWVVAADRAGSAARRMSSMIYATAYAMIAFPLLVESTGRFRLLGSWSAAAGLFSLTVILMGVAVRRRSQPIAWLGLAGALVTTVPLVHVTGRTDAFAHSLILVATVSLWLGYLLDWRWLRWPAAGAANLLVLAAGFRSVAPGGADDPAAALASQIMLLAAVLGSVAVRTLFRHRDVVPFEVAQTVASIGIGLGGAARVTAASGLGRVPFGVASLLLGVGCYAVSLAFIERQRGRGRNFYFYTTAALAFVLAGCGLLLPPPQLAGAWALIALASLAMGRRSRRVTLHAHGALYAAAAAVACGLVTAQARALGLPPPEAEIPSMTRLLVLGVCGAGVLLLAPGHRWQPAGAAQRIPRLLLLILAVAGTAGVLADGLAPLLHRLGGGREMAGPLATLRTALLVASTLVLAWAGGARRFVEARWLVYPLLALTGVKLALQDVRASRPAALALAFAMYGVALIAAPRLRRRGGPSLTSPAA